MRFKIITFDLTVWDGAVFLILMSMMGAIVITITNSQLAIIVIPFFFVLGTMWRDFSKVLKDEVTAKKQAGEKR